MLPKVHLTSHSRVSGSRCMTTPLWLSGSPRSFLYTSSVYSCHLFLISPVSVFYCAQAGGKCSLDVYHFLEEISSLSHSISFFYFCAFVHLRRLSYCSLLFSGTLHSVGYIFPFLLCLSLLLFSQLFVRPPQTTSLPSCISFSLDGFGHHLLYYVINLHP